MEGLPRNWSSLFVIGLKKTGNDPDHPNNWDSEYSRWIKTVTQKPLKETLFKFGEQEITTAQLYKIISRQQDEIKSLKNEIAALKRHNYKYTAPPQKVLEALAIYGD